MVVGCYAKKETYCVLRMWTEVCHRFIFQGKVTSVNGYAAMGIEKQVKYTTSWQIGVSYSGMQCSQ